MTVEVPGRSEPTDGALIERVAKRDRTAFEELYRRFARPVLGLALRRIGDRGRAEDAVQETFTALWRSAARYDPRRGSGSAWLYAVARNAVVDVLRKTPEAVTADAPDRADPATGPEGQAEASWLSWRVHGAIELLPAEQREPLELAYWGGLSQSEIAMFLGIPLGTVKTRTRAALARLAGELEDELR